MIKVSCIRINRLLSFSLKLVILVFFLSGCRDQEIDSTGLLESVDHQRMEDVLSGENLLAVIDNSKLVVIDPASALSTPVYQLKDKESPLALELGSVKVNPTNKFLVWYTPNQGFLKLSIGKSETSLLRPANDWLNQNPFFSFSANGDSIYLVDNQGLDFVTINLESGLAQITPIPFPFGNIFSVSPDDQTILFISGFGQTLDKPEFMFTTIAGQDPLRFSVDTPLTNRFMAAWRPDSQGVFLIQNQNVVIYVPKDNPDQPITFYSDEQVGSITQLSVIDNLLYIFVDNSRWLAFDTTTKQREVSVPVEVAQELYKPQFTPWYDKTFLIEEVLRLDQNQHSRLWISSTMGVKKILMEEYHKVELVTDTPSI